MHVPNLHATAARRWLVDRTALADALQWLLRCWRVLPGRSSYGRQQAEEVGAFVCLAVWNKYVSQSVTEAYAARRGPKALRLIMMTNSGTPDTSRWSALCCGMQERRILRAAMVTAPGGNNTCPLILSCMYVQTESQKPDQRPFYIGPDDVVLN